MVGLSKNAANKRNRKIYKKAIICFNIAYKFDWHPSTFKSLLVVNCIKSTPMPNEFLIWKVPLLETDCCYLNYNVLYKNKSNWSSRWQMFFKIDVLSHLAGLVHLQMFKSKFFISPRWDPGKIKWDST